MATSTILSDNGVTSGTSGIKTTGGDDGSLILQTTTAGGTATTAMTIDTSQNVTFANAITTDQELLVVNTVTVTTNAGTVPVTFRSNKFTNSSAATMTITMATAGAVDGQLSIVRIYDFSAVAQTISWVNTENSTVIAPTTSNGSTTLPVTVGFMYNGSTSKWRCIASA